MSVGCGKTSYWLVIIWEGAGQGEVGDTSTATFTYDCLSDYETAIRAFCTRSHTADCQTTLEEANPHERVLGEEGEEGPEQQVP